MTENWRKNGHLGRHGINLEEMNGENNILKFPLTWHDKNVFKKWPQSSFGMDVEFNERKCGKFFIIINFLPSCTSKLCLVHENSIKWYLVLVGGLGLLGLEEKKSFNIYRLNLFSYIYFEEI